MNHTTAGFALLLAAALTAGCADLRSTDPTPVGACEGGQALSFDCEGLDLMAFMPLADLGAGASLNDIWGWADPETDREYALVGRTDGTAFVDVTNPAAPRLVGELPLTDGAFANVWRDL